MKKVDIQKYKYLFLIYLYVLFSHLYYVFRYSGKWVEWDSDFMVKAFQAVYEQATITPTTALYPNGFGSQVISSFIVNILNISIQEYALFLHPIITTLYVFIAYSLFFEFTKDYRVALLSTFLISLQPEFFWTSARNTHEGFTYLMVLIAAFALVKNISARNFSIHKLASYTLIFYISIICIISLNIFFASSFIFTITFAFIIGYIISKINHAHSNYRRLIYSSSICIILIFTYMFHIYTPAGSFLSNSIHFLDKILILFNAVEEQSSPQYSYILKMWTSQYIWFVLTLFNWFIAATSFTMYAVLLKKFIMGKMDIRPRSVMILLILYTAFSILLLGYILADRFGEYGSNLELRIFPVLMIFAVPLAAMLIFKIFDSKVIIDRNKKYLKFCFIIILVLFVGNSLIKGTNDPIVSNKWTFYSTQEENGIQWVDSNLHGKDIWAGLDERLLNLFNLKTELSSYKKVNFVNLQKGEYYFFSEIINKRAIRTDYLMPSIDSTELIYNNGDVTIHKRYVLS